MKYTYFVVIVFLSCNSNSSTNQTSVPDSTESRIFSTNDTIQKPKTIWVDRLNGAAYPLPDSIGNKPVSFYLDNAKVADISKAFYRAHFRPADNDSTIQLLSYVTINDSMLRPFYRWCLDFTIMISDGALAEYPGEPALAYATKFPEEFFSYMDSDKSGKRYKQWTEIIAYSGLSDYNKKEVEIQNELVNNMKTNCYMCSGETKNRIAAFAQDIIKAIKLQD